MIQQVRFLSINRTRLRKEELAPGRGAAGSHHDSNLPRSSFGSAREAKGALLRALCQRVYRCNCSDSLTQIKKNPPISRNEQNQYILKGQRSTEALREDRDNVEANRVL